MDWGLVIAALVLVVTISGGFATWVLRFGKAENAAELGRQALAKAESNERDLADFKERVARDYATASMVAAVASRVEASLDRLADRLDRILESRATPRKRTPSE